MYISNKLQETLEIRGVRVQEGINFIAQVKLSDLLIGRICMFTRSPGNLYEYSSQRSTALEPISMNTFLVHWKVSPAVLNNLHQ